jgi:hypothetical protein
MAWGDVTQGGTGRVRGRAKFLQQTRRRGHNVLRFRVRGAVVPRAGRAFLRGVARGERKPRLAVVQTRGDVGTQDPRP